MTDVGKAVQWRSCPEGHLHLGQECPCEYATLAIEPASGRGHLRVPRLRGQKPIEEPDVGCCDREGEQASLSPERKREAR